MDILDVIKKIAAVLNCSMKELTNINNDKSEDNVINIPTEYTKKHKVTARDKKQYIDYFTRFILSKNKKEFFRHNIIDLIAIIPFNSIFQVARILKITRLARLTKIFKVFRLLRVFVLLEKFKKNFHH
ncbi:hypothetical protein [Clostridium pasteurianum]|uniref:hypothetical protein n=1 Tax=Clostridium pasteurianum TaxID=1501 RepID=UPI00155AF110|nr:hypothetical protein [Clostridium pasteurianum]